jgi:hypothetical protein
LSSSTDCTVKGGKYAVLLKDNNVRVSEETHSLTGCKLEDGSVIRIYTELPTEEEADRLVPENPRSLKVEEEEQVETVAEIPVSAEIEQVTDAATQLGGEYAPIVAVVLALLAVLGGKKAWSFYSERAEQKHEIELKKLEMQRDMAGAGAVSPPPCQAIHAKLEAEVAEAKAKVGLLEKRLLVLGDDFDPEDMERQLRRLQKAVKFLQEDGEL